MELKHYQTEKMIADFFTKPLQGGLFRTTKNYIMGHAEILMEEHIGTDSKNDNKSNKIAIRTEHKTKERQKSSYANVVKSSVVAKNTSRKEVKEIQNKKMKVSAE